MLVIAIIVIIVAIVIAERQKMMHQKMVDEHREMLIKVVDNYQKDGGWLNANDRVNYCNAIKRGEYDDLSASALESDLAYEEYANWCAR